MENNVIERNKSKNLVVIILAILLLAACGFICYDKLLKKGASDSIDCPKCQECENTTSHCNCTDVSNFGQKISSVKEVKLTTKNQTIKIGNKAYKIKNGTYDGSDGFLSIDDYIVNYFLGDGEVHFDRAYLTDKFMFFTAVAQDGEMIQYVLGEKGEIIPNNNEYQMNNFKIVDGYLHASGHILCGLEDDCPDKDLLIKYIDNTLIVVENK